MYVATQLTGFNSAEDAKLFLNDMKDGCTTPDLCNFNYDKYLSGEAVRTWKYLYDYHPDRTNKAKFARKYWPTLNRFKQLNSDVQKEIIKFSDANSGSTLKEFCTDLDQNNGFLGFVKNRLNFAKGFVGHKQDPLYTANDYELLTEELKDSPLNPTLNDLIVSWLAYSKEDAQRKNYYQQGKNFENWIKEQLKNSQNVGYQQLKASFLSTDGWNLDDYTIYSQVYLCINGSTTATCTDEGSYFIADFVFVKTFYNPISQKDELDIKIADTKLSAGTDFTKNQKESKKQNSLFIRTDAPVPIKGNPIPLFNKPNSFVNSKVIYKIYSGVSTSNYGGVTK